LEDKVTNNKMRWYAHILRVNEDRIPKTVLNTKVKGKCPRGTSRSRWEQQVRKYVTQREGRTQGGNEDDSYGKTEKDGEKWLSHAPLKEEMS
jgi:hypothetical protein